MPMKPNIYSKDHVKELVTKELNIAFAHLRSGNRAGASEACANVSILLDPVKSTFKYEMARVHVDKNLYFISQYAAHKHLISKLYGAGQ